MSRRNQSKMIKDAKRETALSIFRKLAEKMGEWKFGRPEITLNAIEDSEFYKVASTYGLSETDITKENSL